MCVRVNIVDGSVVAPGHSICYAGGLQLGSLENLRSSNKGGMDPDGKGAALMQLSTLSGCDCLTETG